MAGREVGIGRLFAILHLKCKITLSLIGLEKLSSGDELPIAAAEVAIAALVLGRFPIELRAAIRHSKRGAWASEGRVVRLGGGRPADL